MAVCQEQPKLPVRGCERERTAHLAACGPVQVKARVATADIDFMVEKPFGNARDTADLRRERRDQADPARRTLLARRCAGPSHHRNVVQTCSLLALAVAALAVCAPAQARIAKRLDFDTGNFRQWSAMQAVAGGATIVRRPRHQGRYAARFRIRPGDKPIGGNNERAEVVAHTGEKSGVTSWWKWSTFFPRSFRPVPSGINVFTQWHHNGSTCHPPVQFVISPNLKRLQLRVSGGRFNPATCWSSGGHVYDLGRLRRGRWLTFVFHVRWSPKQGFVEVWRNGKRVVRHSRVKTIYAGYTVNLKQGYYRRHASWSTVVYHDGTRRTTSRPRSLR
jgi:hypothetical protein